MTKCANCQRLENELRRIANANMTSSHDKYLAKCAASTDSLFKKLQMENAELKREKKELEEKLNGIETKKSFSDCCKKPEETSSQRQEKREL